MCNKERDKRDHFSFETKQSTKRGILLKCVLYGNQWVKTKNHLELFEIKICKYIFIFYKKVVDVFNFYSVREFKIVVHRLSAPLKKSL